MRMKKLLVLLSFVPVVLLTSCKSDDENIDVTGKWRMVSYKVGDMSLMLKCDTLTTLEFKNDGTLVDYQNCTKESQVKNYSVNWVNVTFDDTKYTAKISADTLNLSHIDIMIIPVGTVKVYKKIK